MSLWAPQDAFFIKLLLSRLGSIADPSNRKEETQKLSQNDEAEEYVPNKTTR